MAHVPFNKRESTTPTTNRKMDKETRKALLYGRKPTTKCRRKDEARNY